MDATYTVFETVHSLHFLTQNESLWNDWKHQDHEQIVHRLLCFRNGSGEGAYPSGKLDGVYTFLRIH